MLYKTKTALMCLLIIASTVASTTHALPEKTLRPIFLSVDVFRDAADFVYDETRNNLNPAKVRPGDIIFVKTDYLAEFFSTIHPRIPYRYILVTHNSDLPIPGSFAYMLEDPKLIAWFGKNVEGSTHSKLHPIPIGLATRTLPHGDINVFYKVQGMLAKITRKHLLYMNILVGTYSQERGPLYSMFVNQPFCKVCQPTKAPYDFLIDLAESLCVLCPRGNGVETHRTWEALYMGAIPIVRTSDADSMYDGLPVIIVEEWSEVTEEFLRAKYQEISTKNYQLERMYAPYWIDKILSMKESTRGR